MCGRPKFTKNKKYFILLKELNNLFDEDYPVAITKDLALTLHKISPNLILTDNKNMPVIKEKEKIDFQIL